MGFPYNPKPYTTCKKKMQVLMWYWSMLIIERARLYKKLNSFCLHTLLWLKNINNQCFATKENSGHSWQLNHSSPMESSHSSTWSEGKWEQIISSETCEWHRHDLFTKYSHQHQVINMKRHSNVISSTVHTQRLNLFFNNQNQFLIHSNNDSVS